MTTVWIVLESDYDQYDTIRSVHVERCRAVHSLMEWVREKEGEFGAELNEGNIELDYDEDHAWCGDDWGTEGVTIVEMTVT